MSLRAYAKHRGVSLAAVQKAVKAERIKLVEIEKGKFAVDPLTADRDWESNTDHSKNHSPAKKRIPRAAPAPQEWETQTDDEGSDDAEEEPLSLAKARAERERYQAKTAKLNFELKSGKLVALEQVKSEAFNTARMTREALLNIPNKLSHELAAETDSLKIFNLLTDSISEALEELVAKGLAQ